MLTIAFDNIRARVIGAITTQAKRDLVDVMSYENPDSWFIPNYRKPTYFDVKRQTFPTGLLSEARRILNEAGYDISFQDERTRPVPGLELPLNIDLYPYQQNAVEAALKRTRGIVRSPTGSGKTEMFAAITGRLNMPTMIYTHRVIIAEQTRDRLKERLEEDIGLICGKCFDPAPITVCTINKAARAIQSKVKMDKDDDEKVSFASEAQKSQLKAMIQNASVFVIDEAHHIPCNTAMLVARTSRNAFYRYGFSATPWRDDGATILIQLATGRPIVEISISDLVGQGYLSPIDIYSFSIPRADNAAVISRLSYPEIYRQMVTNNESRNAIINQTANFMAVRQNSVLVAVTQIDHGERLLQNFKTLYPRVNATMLQGITNATERRQALQDLKDKKLQVMFATTVFGEGVDVPSLDCLINTKAAASSVDTLQLLGRVTRIHPGKKRGVVFDFNDQTKYLKAHYKKRLRAYRCESCFGLHENVKLPDLTNLFA